MKQQNMWGNKDYKLYYKKLQIHGDVKIEYEIIKEATVSW